MKIAILIGLGLATGALGRMFGIDTVPLLALTGLAFIAGAIFGIDWGAKA